MLIFVLASLPGSSSLYAQESTEEPTPVVTDSPPTDPPPSPTEPPVTEPPVTEPPATEPPATETLAPEVTGEPSVTETPAAPETTPEPTAEPDPTDVPQPPAPPAGPMDGGPQPVPQTSCRMEVGDAGDSNPYTYSFQAISSPNITDWDWDLGDGTTVDDTQQIPSYTYSLPGTYTITLVCTPPSGVPLLLTGTITVTSNPVAAFDLLPSNVVVDKPPFLVSTLNRSTGGTLTHLWRVSTSNNPLDLGAVIATFTTENITNYSIANYGIYWFHLFVTDLGGITVGASQQFSLLEPPPVVRFDMTPSDGISPLDVTFTPVDLGGGPVTSWRWDFGDGSPIETYATAQVVTHQFTYNPATHPNGRTYIVTLRATGPRGDYYEFAREVGVYPPLEPVDANFNWENRGNAGGGLVTICFNNLSTGPWVNSYWDWNDDGTYDLQTTDPVVCHDFAEGTYSVRLWVADNLTDTPAGIPTGSTSNAAQNVSVVAAPVASFTANPGTTITWGDLIGFTDTSTGSITSWSWDFDGDGIEDSNQRNPANIALGRTIGSLGGNTVRLTVTGPGGSSYAEMLIVVARLNITCTIGGLSEVSPTASNQSYTGTIGSLSGRTLASYTWRVTGTDSVPPATLPLVSSGGPVAAVPNLPLNFANFGVGTFVLTLEATTTDGASCSDTHTVTYRYPPLDCRILTSPAFASPQYPSTTNFNFSIDNANLNLDGRPVNSIRWTVNGSPQPAFDDLQTFTRQWLSAATETIRYDIEVDNGDGTTSTCYEELPVTITDWPTLSCTGMNGTFNPQPVSPDNPTRQYTYTALLDPTTIAGRTVIYTWAITGGTILPPGNTATVTARWDASAGSLAPASADDVISYTARVNNPDGTFDECGITRNDVAVTVRRLTCNAPSGDIFPVVGETEAYNMNLVNSYGRPITVTWDFEVFNTVSGLWEDVVPPPAVDLTANPFSYNYLVPDARYRLRYSASAAAAGGLPADSCGPSSYLTPIQVGGADVTFDCDAFPGAPINNLNAASASTRYPYTIDMDNGNALPLDYTWWLVGPGATERLLGTFNDVTTNGMITFPPAPSTGFLGADFGPVDNYTLRVDVRSDDPAVTHQCSMSQPLTVGTLTVNYTYVDSGGAAVNPNAVEVGREICFTNTSFTSHGGIDSMAYDWTFGTANNSLGVTGQTNTQNPSSCFSFTQPSGPGGYTVTLTGTALDLNGNRNSRTASRAYTFYVYGSQSIAINRTNQQFAPTTMSFTPVGVNITAGYNWLFELWNGTAWTNFANNTKSGPGTVNQYFPVAGRYRATVTGSGPLGTTTAQAEFELLDTNSIRAAFTPSPYGGMAPLNVCFTDRSASNTAIVSWEWDFNNDGIIDSTQQNPCTTYTAAGQSYVVRLNIRNSAGLVATATNVVRTYREWESAASFSIAPQGAGRYCFTANVTGLTLLGWDYGDGATGPANTVVCHTYASSGTYVVSMTIQNPTTGETGVIQRGLEVDLSGGPVPSLSASASCAADRTASFRITNSGGAMTVADIVIFRDASGSVIRTESVLLAAGAYRDFILTDMDGPVSLETIDSGLSTTASCYYRPVITVSATCGANNLPVFTVTNARPSDGPMHTTQTFTITGSSGNDVTPAPGTFQLTLGEASETHAVPAGNDPYDTYTFSSNGLTGTFNVSHNCATRPVLTVSSQCVAGNPAFTVTNTSANNMVLAQPFTINSSVDGDVTPAPGTFQLAAGASTTFTLTGLDPYAVYTFTSSGFAGTLSNVRSCGSPTLTVTSACTSPIAFTVSNNGADMLMPQNYTITDGGGAAVDSGSFQLAASDTLTVTLTGRDPYAGYTFASTGFAGTLSLAQNCARPVLTATSACTDPLAFTISNSGGDMLAAQPYSITRSSGADVTPAPGTFQLAGGDSETITLTGISPYNGYTIATTGFAGTFSEMQNCAAPRLRVESACTSPAAFTITNSGGQMLIDQPFTLIEGGSADITPASNLFSLAPGGTLVVTVPASADLDAGVTFSTARFEAAASLTMRCPSGSGDTQTSTGAAVASASRPGSGPGFSGLGAGVFSLLNWTGTPTCGPTCPVWRLYHSDDTGDWEIFRLDGAVNQQTQRVNLSHGEGADDMAPSRSPDSRWVIFTSNRDTVEGQPENWELYVASTSGDPASVQRVTYNSIALDTNPAWGPNNYVVFQTTRHGNWDLYMIDMETGIEYRLTDSDWNEINPNWSPDGSRVAFQSDRDGQWHIYVLDIARRTITQLTGIEGDTIYDVDPQFAPDGSRIAFRRYTQPGGPSTLMLMDADGQNQRAITAPDMDATNQAWSPSGRLIAFQAIRSGQLDVYVYDTASGKTRQLTDSAIRDYAPTWLCNDEIVVFTSDISGSPDIYEAPALPIDADAIAVDEDAERLTFETANDIYPQNMPPKEFASREGQTSDGVFGLQTEFLLPDANVTPPDVALDDITRELWQAINTCPAPGA